MDLLSFSKLDLCLEVVQSISFELQLHLKGNRETISGGEEVTFSSRNKKGLELPLAKSSETFSSWTAGSFRLIIINILIMSFQFPILNNDQCFFKRMPHLGRRSLLVYSSKTGKRRTQERHFCSSARQRISNLLFCLVANWFLTVTRQQGSSELFHI